MRDEAKYDRIGIGYTKYRRPDPRLVQAIIHHLGLPPRSTVADIGAGTGSYSAALAAAGFSVKAVEPSQVMRGQAVQHERVEWYAGVAEDIPLPDRSVAGAISVLAVHHLGSFERAARELVRISAGPIVLFTYDPRESEPFWLSNYFPEMFEFAYRLFPPLTDVQELFAGLGRTSTVIPFALPHDLQDLFLAAAWRRPRLYLDPEVRACMSVFASASLEAVRPRIDRLRRDLESGAWQKAYGSILEPEEFDAGYRFVRVGEAQAAIGR